MRININYTIYIDDDEFEARYKDIYLRDELRDEVKQFAENKLAHIMRGYGLEYRIKKIS